MKEKRHVCFKQNVCNETFQICQNMCHTSEERIYVLENIIRVKLSQREIKRVKKHERTIHLCACTAQLLRHFHTTIPVKLRSSISEL